MQDRKLKLLLVVKGIKNFDLAKHLNCDPAKVSKIVNGWITPDEKTKIAIAEHLGVKVGTIFPKER